MAVPVLSLVSPTPTSTVGASEFVQFTLTSTPGLLTFFLMFRYPGMGIEELAIEGTAPTAAYAPYATVQAVTNGYKVTLHRNPVWPASFDMHLWAVNTSAEVLETSWSYVLADTPVDPPIPPPIPSFPVGSPAATADSGLTQFSQDDLLRLADQVLDSDYVHGLKSGEGYEILQAYAAQFARLSEAVRHTGDGSFVSYAHGGSYAQGAVELFRTGVGNPAVVVKAGTVVTAAGGKFFRSLEDAVFAHNDNGPHAVHVQSIFQTWQGNTVGRTITPRGDTLPGEIDTIRILVEDPPYGDPNIQVRQINPTTGGAFPMLDLLALQNRLMRRRGESDESLAFRIRNLPDNLTPAAIKRAITTLLGAAHVSYEFVESWNPKFQTAYDMPDVTAHSNVFTYDDPRPRYFPALDWYADSREQWGTFYVVVAKIQPIRDYGGAYDDVALDAAHLVSSRTGGRRALPAYDLADSSTFGTGVDLGMAYDGRDVGQDALLRSVYSHMQALRAGGIVAGLLQDGR